jgi:hypothetical protein
MNNATMRRYRLTTVCMETQKCIPFDTTCYCQQCDNTECCQRKATMGWFPLDCCPATKCPVLFSIISKYSYLNVNLFYIFV